MAELVERGWVDRLAQDEPVILIGPQCLLSAAFAPHDDQAGAVADRVGCEEAIELGVEPAVQVGDDFRERLKLDALPPEQPDLPIELTCCGGDIVEPLRAVDPARDELRVARDEAQQVDILENADELCSIVHPDTPLVVLGHQQQRGEDEVVRRQADDVVMREIGDRCLQRQAA